MYLVYNKTVTGVIATSSATRNAIGYTLLRSHKCTTQIKLKVSISLPRWASLPGHAVPDVPQGIRN